MTLDMHRTRIKCATFRFVHYIRNEPLFTYKKFLFFTCFAKSQKKYSTLIHQHKILNVRYNCLEASYNHFRIKLFSFYLLNK